MTTKKTELEYTKLARFFYQRLENKSLPLTAKNIAHELLTCAPNYRPGYWQRLRCALVYHQNTLGYVDAAERIRGTKNPVTAYGSKLSVKSRQPRVRSINPTDEAALILYFNQRGDISMVSTILIFKNTGIRPAELAGLRVDGNRLIVMGAKRSHDGKRGADRILLLDGIDSGMLKYCVMQAQRVDVGVMQDRLRAAGKKLWPRRKSLPTFYSWRHQLGSELKGSGLDRQRIAYVMGHQATASVDRYGNRKSARGGRLPSCPTDADLIGIRITHSQLSADNTHYIKQKPPVINQVNNNSVGRRGLAAFIRRGKNESSGNDLS
ncbi:site-specific integrase [Aeromonas sp. QDB03]|uniref:site-specific integrase n=1 Tax=Aeromonas sp. QDB03 TaxID=2989839 RepID=UPI0022E8EC97|nr:site-specific integrase [Aeromonas sp. QDB03]